MKNHILHLILKKKLRYEKFHAIYWKCFFPLRRVWARMMLTNQLMWNRKFISMLCRYFSVLPPSFRHWEEKSHKVYLKFMLTVDVREVQAVFGNFVAFLDLLSTPTMKESMPWRNIYYDGEIKHARNHFVAFLRTHSEIELEKEDGGKENSIFTANFTRWAAIIQIFLN